jgi:hypothetical protein
MKFDPATAKLEFDPSTANIEEPNLRDTVAKAFEPAGLDVEQAEQVKTLSYLEQKGYGVSDGTAETYQQALFGGKPWSAINSQLAEQLSMTSLGPVKNAAKTKPIRVPDFVMTDGGVTEFSGFNGAGSEQVLPTGAKYGGILAEAAAQAPIGAIYGAPAAVAAGLSTGFNFVGDLARGSGIEDLFYDAGRRAGDFSDKLSASADQATEFTQMLTDAPKDIRENIAGQFMAGGGSMLGFIATRGAGKGAVPAAMTGSLYKESYSRFSDKYSPEEAKKLALMYTSVWVPLEMYSFGQYTKPLKGGGLKAMLRKGGEAIPEALTETGEQWTADAVVNEISDPVEYMKTAAMTYVTTLFVAGGVEFGARNYQIGKTKATLTKSGMTDARAYDTAIRLAQAETQAEYDKILDESVKSSDQLSGILNNALADIADVVQPVTEVTGYNGGVITFDDLATYRNKDGFVESLDDSPQAELLKKAITENDEAALAEYNQGLLGVAEEASAIETESQQATNELSEQEEIKPSGKKSIFSGTMAADYFLNGGAGAMRSTEYLLQAYSGMFSRVSDQIEEIREKYKQEITDNGLDDISKFKDSELYSKIMEEIRGVVTGSYNKAEAENILTELFKHPSGTPVKTGTRIRSQIEALDTSVETPTQEAPATAASLDEQTDPNTALRQRDARALLQAMGSEKQIGSQVITDEALLQKVRDSGMVDDALNISRRLLKTGEAHTAEEHIALVLATNDRITRINELNQRLNEAVANGEDTDGIIADKAILNEDLETIALASDKSGSPLGRALRVRRLKPDLTYDEPSVRARATVIKGEKLTETEFKELADKTKELKEWEELAEALQKDIEALQARSSKDMAQEVVTKELSRVKSERKKSEIKKTRADAKAKLLEMGYRVNDIVGLPFEAAKIISDIAISHIQEGATTLEEVVRRVIEDVPDASPKNVYDSLGGRVKRSVEKAKSDVDSTIKELKSQAKLYGQIEDAMNGVFDPASPQKPSSKEVSDLRLKLKLYGASVKNTEMDNLRVEAILEHLADIDDMIERVYRPIRVIRTKSDALKEAERLLKIGNAELSAQNRIAILEEILRGDEQNYKPHKDLSGTSQRLEKFRAEIAMLKEEIAKGKEAERKAKKEAEKAEKEAAELELITGEIEQAFRRIKKPSQPAEQKNADLKLIRSRQDKIFSLIDRLNGVSTAKPIAKVEVEDSAGYLGMINSLKEEIAKKQAEENAIKAQAKREQKADEKIAKLTDEVEKFYREIPTTTKEQQKTGREEQIAALNEAKRQQDQIANLIEILRNKKVPERTAAQTKADPEGYVATINNLRQEIQNSEWHKEWQKIRHEAKKLAQTNEDIAELERRIRENDLEGFVTPRKERIILDQNLVEAELRKFQLKREIERRIRALKPKTWKDWAHDIYNIPRAAKLTADLGHIFLQGGVPLSNPRKLNIFKFGNASFKALASQEKADIINKWVSENENYQDGIDHGLAIVEEGAQMHGVERMLQASLLDETPFIGRITEASSRAQLTGINLLRMQMYDGFIRRHPEATDEEKTTMCSVINVVTGKATDRFTKFIARDADWLLTSTTFAMSRIQTPFQIFRPKVFLSKSIRDEVIADGVWFLSVRLGIMGLLAGLFPETIHIGSNPASVTFGCLIIDLGNGYSRIYDPWAGLKTVARVAYKILDGEEQPLAPIAEFFASKITPPLALLYNVVHGKKFPNQDVSRLEAIVRGILPVSLEGVVDDMAADTGVADLLSANLINAFGINSYTMKTEDLEGKTTWSEKRIADAEREYRKQEKEE